jgi:NAD(P)-dependent dehydrogenase (short-subunit alcohol dehydrogenase family)
MNAIVIGGSGGIGNAFVNHLLDNNNDITIHATYYATQPEAIDARCTWHKLDITNDYAIAELCNTLDDVHLCINAAGMLHDSVHQPEKSTRQITSDYFLKSMTINTLPTLLLAKHLASNFKHKQPAVFATVSARVGSIEENYLGGWYSYRSSKAALNMVLKTLSIEWQRSLPNVAVAALHPGTTNTSLSQPFQKNVPKNQLFSPKQSVSYMMDIIKDLKPEDTGKFWSFDGEILPW